MANQHLAIRNGGNAVTSVKKLATSPAMVNRFQEVLGERASQFLAGVISATNVNPALAKCDPNTVMASAMVAATLDLDVIPGLGFAAIVPYKGSCQFQIMTRGLIQLALRSGQYLAINAGELYEDEFLGQNPITGEIKWKLVPGGFRDKGKEDKIVGYFAYFKFVNGFEKTVYWSKDKVIQHAMRFSKSFNNGPWKDHFNAMAEKTVLKNALQHYGMLNVKMQTALIEDQKVYNAKGEGAYEDNPSNSYGEEDISAPSVAEAEDAEVVQEQPSQPQAQAQPAPQPEKMQEPMIEGQMTEEEYQELLREGDNPDDGDSYGF